MEYITTFNETTALFGVISLLFFYFQMFFVQSWVAHFIVKFSILSKTTQHMLVGLYAVYNIVVLIVSVMLIGYYPHEALTFALWSTLAYAPFHKRVLAWGTASFMGYIDQAKLELELYEMGLVGTN
jgi:hypothetical protein